MSELSKYSEEELKKFILTGDYKGAAFKEEVLDEIIERREAAVTREICHNLGIRIQ